MNDSNLIREVLERAGWHDGENRGELVARWARELETPGGFVMHEAARAALLRYGAVDVKEQGSGIECSREPFEIDPTLCQMYEDEFAKAGQPYGLHLFPLGEAIASQAFLAIDQHGAVYLLDEENGLARIAHDIDDAIKRLIEGRKPEPLS